MARVVPNLPRSPVAFVAEAYRAYASLIASADNGARHLGGRLFYAGELDDRAQALVAAANIAGAATLAASADPVALRDGLREGIIDFLVNSLDETLRILKNEVRKREPVSVAVSLAPAAIEAEMMERGVLPDLLAEQAASDASNSFLADGARRIGAALSTPGTRLCIWSTPPEFAQTPAAFEAALLAHIPVEDEAARRWVHLSPRYLGRAARGLRSLPCNERTEQLLTALVGVPIS